MYVLLIILYASRFFSRLLFYAFPGILRNFSVEIVDEIIKEISSGEAKSIASAAKEFLLTGDLSSLIRSLGYLRVAPRAISLVNSLDKRVYRKLVVKLFKRLRYLHLSPLAVRLAYIFINTA